MLARIIGYLRERSALLRILFFGLLACIVGFDFMAERHEAHFWGDSIYGFWAMAGLGGCVVMTLFWKGLAHFILMKDKGYYDNE